MQIKQIRNEVDLSKAIKLLQESFKWSSRKAKKINQNIIKNNKSLGIYGYSIRGGNGLIYGALLIFDQGSTEIMGEKIKVLNMSSWYVKQKVRGYFALKMIKIFLKDFSNCLITNVSSNKKAYLVLKSFGFKDSKDLNRKFSTLSLILNSNFIRNIKFKFLFSNKIKKAYEFPQDFAIGNSYCREFTLDNQKLEVITCPAILEKKIGFFYLRIKGTRILWTSNPKIFYKYFYLILIFYTFRYFSFFTTTHFDLYPPLNCNFRTTKQIYFIKNKKLDSKINISLGSELVFF